MAIDNTNTNRLFATAGEQKKPTGTGYTNLNRFFSANQGNQLGQKVTGGIQSQIGQVKGQLGQQQEQFQTEAEKNKLGSEEQKAERAAVIGRFSDASTQAEGPSEQDIQKFQQFRGGQYSGPSGLKDTQALTSQAQDIRAQTSNLSPSGTQELLRRSVGGNNYTQGQQRLDTLLLDRSGLRAAGREAAGLGAGINQANLAAQGQAQSLQNQAKQFGQETEQQLQGALSGLDVESQKQLASAQAAEQDRLARIQAVQEFAANKRAKIDPATGQPAKDQYGNIQYEEGGVRTAADQYGQLDELSNLLRSKGAQQEEIDKLIGSGNFAQGKQTFDQARRDAVANQILNLGGSSTGGGGGGLDIQQGIMSAHPEYAKKVLSEKDKLFINSKGYKPEYTLAPDTEKIMADIRSGKLDLNVQVGKGGTLDNLVAGRSSTLQGGWVDAYNQANTKATQDLYSNRGIAGEALKAGKTEDLFKNLAASLSNSQAAQGLTEQGVAAQPLRANYSALQQLLGKSADELKFKDGAEQYKAGQFLLNPDAIRRTF